MFAEVLVLIRKDQDEFCSNLHSCNISYVSIRTASKVSALNRTESHSKSELSVRRAHHSVLFISELFWWFLFWIVRTALEADLTQQRFLEQIFRSVLSRTSIIRIVFKKGKQVFKAQFTPPPSLSYLGPTIGIRARSQSS